ncbi:hypothetical protein HPB49_011400 [Dermacentor silvarum]|uniref:Uncharacterized protein n=1 Tax=Dermacentor silvarum TaxID=543639 RepID=A0ACB8D527_DERSI|nr:hypothetical protein HPB49_011400 [Dermacentor silvarum]
MSAILCHRPMVEAHQDGTNSDAVSVAEKGSTVSVLCPGGRSWKSGLYDVPSWLIAVSRVDDPSGQVKLLWPSKSSIGGKSSDLSALVQHSSVLKKSVAAPSKRNTWNNSTAAYAKSMPGKLFDRDVEKDLVTELVRKYKCSIENKKSDTVSRTRKLKSWEALTAEFNSTENVRPRTVAQLRKLWDNMKQ